MDTKRTNILLGGLVLVAVIAGIALYPQLPERIVTHWSIAGTPNGYMNKFWGVFLLPGLMLGMLALYLIIPKIDPYKENFRLFRSQYNGFWIFLFLFMQYIFILQTGWNLGWRFDLGKAMTPAIAVLWYAVGMMVEKAKRNWFVGIRTPWTLSSDAVWDKTHKLGAKLFKVAAGISFLGFFFDSTVAFVMVIVLAVAIAVITLVYSYLEYRKSEK